MSRSHGAQKRTDYLSSLRIDLSSFSAASMMRCVPLLCATLQGGRRGVFGSPPTTEWRFGYAQQNILVLHRSDLLWTPPIVCGSYIDSLMILEVF